MKNVYLLILLFCPVLLLGQLTANAGDTVVHCGIDTTIYMGGVPSASGGTPPYTYQWHMTHPSGYPNIPPVYASNILSDTSIGNPKLLNSGYLGNDTATLYLTVIDLLGQQATDSVTLLTATPLAFIPPTPMQYYLMLGDTQPLTPWPISSSSEITEVFYTPATGLSNPFAQAPFYAAPLQTTAYEFHYVNTLGCVYEEPGFNFTVHVFPLGAPSFNFASFDVFPIPTSGWVHIRNRLNMPIHRIEMISINGQTLKVWGSQNTLNLTPFATGTYFIRIHTKHHTEVFQILKE